VLLGLAAAAWAVVAGFVSHWLIGFGVSDLSVGILLAVTFGGPAAITALVVSAGPWGAFLVLGQVAGMFASYLLVNGHPPYSLLPHLIATLLLAGAVAWRSAGIGSRCYPH
jgi:hypothetical protein